MSSYNDWYDSDRSNTPYWQREEHSRHNESIDSAKRKLTALGNVTFKNVHHAAVIAQEAAAVLGATYSSAERSGLPSLRTDLDGITGEIAMISGEKPDNPLLPKRIARVAYYLAQLAQTTPIRIKILEADPQLSKLFLRMAVPLDAGLTVQVADHGSPVATRMEVKEKDGNTHMFSLFLPEDVKRQAAFQLDVTIQCTVGTSTATVCGVWKRQDGKNTFAEGQKTHR